jgi:hypothetical protein
VYGSVVAVVTSAGSRSVIRIRRREADSCFTRQLWHLCSTTIPTTYSQQKDRLGRSRLLTIASQRDIYRERQHRRPRPGSARTARHRCFSSLTTHGHNDSQRPSLAHSNMPSQPPPTTKPTFSLAPPPQRTWSANAPPSASTASDPADRFVLLDKLGSGNFGTVWKAVDKKRGIIVAVKMISESFSSSC